VANATAQRPDALTINPIEVAAIVRQDGEIVVECCCTNEIKVSYRRAGGTESPSSSSKNPTSVSIDPQHHYTIAFVPFRFTRIKS
jgi:hypothetical protein